MAQKVIYFAAGCFWGAEKYFRLIKGVLSTEVGFANGNTPDPTYEQVYTDTTGYAETVKVCYDPDDADPVSEVLAEAEKALGQPLAVECLPLRNFYRAEEYHQLYLEKNPGGYCHLPPGIFEIAKKY